LIQLDATAPDGHSAWSWEPRLLERSHGNRVDIAIERWISDVRFRHHAVQIANIKYLGLGEHPMAGTSS
jgi:hypothetical protein